MKIIKEGDLSRLKDLRQYRDECPRCGCVFEFHWAEAIHHYGWDCNHSVECPTCRGIMGLMSDHVKMIER